MPQPCFATGAFRGSSRELTALADHMDDVPVQSATIEGDLVVLRRPDERDLAARRQAGVDPEVELGYGVRSDARRLLNDAEARAWLDHLRAQPWAWVIVHDEQPIGHLVLHTLDEARQEAFVAVGLFRSDRHRSLSRARPIGEGSSGSGPGLAARPSRGRPPVREPRNRDCACSARTRDHRRARCESRLPSGRRDRAECQRSRLVAAPRLPPVRPERARPAGSVPAHLRDRRDAPPSAVEQTGPRTAGT